MTYKAKNILNKVAGVAPFMKILAPIGGAAVVGWATQNPKGISSRRYLQYLGRHKYHIAKTMKSMGLGWGQALKHDISKLGPKEFGPYRDWFESPEGTKGTRDPEVFNKWRKAVQHHYTRPSNLHHYRRLGMNTTNTPLKYQLEALADWYSVGKARGKVHGSFPQWYTRLKDKLPITPQVKNIIDKRFGLEKSPEIDRRTGEVKELGTLA